MNSSTSHEFQFYKMCHLFSFFSLKSFSITHLAWLSPLSRGQGGFPAYAYARKRDVCLLSNLTPTLSSCKIEAEMLYRFSRISLCANSKAVQGAEACWKYTDQEDCPFPNPVFPRPISPVSMDTFGFGQNVTHWPRSLLPYRKGAQAHSNHLVI